ncbi:ABC transporter permease (plasmid) [Paraburkholderia caribensis]|nr:ABC transporter permease [Paraburkholderia caribensis]AUT58119.1 amino acid ABC transporter permease [Paraburkholderia caribensis]
MATLRLTCLAFLLSLAFGLVLALACRARARIPRIVARTYVELVRGMPALTLLLLIYFALPSIGISFGSVGAAVVGLGLNGAAYLSEIYRSGIEAVDDGQWEAAQMLGMTPIQVFRDVIFPQALRIVLPPMANFAITLMKDTSVASLIAAPELMLQARDLTGEYFMPLQIYVAVGAAYFCLAFPLSCLVRWMERRYARTAQTGA